MSNDIELVALGLIVLSTGQIGMSGDMHDDGSPIMRPVLREVRPGQRFWAKRELINSLLAGPKPFAAYPGTEAAQHAIARMAARDD